MSCGETGMRNVHVCPSCQAPQYISRDYAIKSLFSVAILDVFHHNPFPTSGAIFLGMLTNIFCRSEEAIEMGTTAMRLGFSTNT